MRPIFVRTRYAYDSYSDFWKLVELSGFETCFVDEINLAGDYLYILPTINGEVRPHLSNEKFRTHFYRARIAVILLERPDSGDQPIPFSKSAEEMLTWSDVLWSPDEWLRIEAKTERCLHVPLGSHPGLGCPDRRSTFEFDYTHMSYVNGRRDSIYGQLLDMKQGPACWEPERGRILNSTRMMINVHQTPAPMGEPLRFAVAAAYKIPVVSETIELPFPLVNKLDYFSAPFHNLAGLIQRFHHDPTPLGGKGEALYNRLCLEWTFERCINEGVKKTLDLFSAMR